MKEPIADSKADSRINLDSAGVGLRLAGSPSPRRPLIREAIQLAFCMAFLSCLSSVPVVAQTPQDGQFFDSSGVQIRYVDKGEGDPVLLIHGFTSRLEFWETSGIVAGLTKSGFRVVAYDARGHGASGKPHDPEQYGEEDVEDALRLLDHISIERAHVVGYSRGSMIASRLVDQHPDRVRSVVFGGWATDNPVSTLSLADCQAAADELARGAFPLPLMRALQPRDSPMPPTDERPQFLDDLVAANDMTALAAAFRSGCEPREITAAALGTTGVPALAIVGARDGIAPSVRAMGREMADAVQILVIPEADHFTAAGHPKFFARLVSFLRESD